MQIPHTLRSNVGYAAFDDAKGVVFFFLAGERSRLGGLMLFEVNGTDVAMSE